MKKIVCDRCGNVVDGDFYSTDYSIVRIVMIGEPTNHLHGDLCEECTKLFEYEFLGKKNH